MPAASKGTIWVMALLVVLYTLLSGCTSRDSHVHPLIEFTRVPPADEGDPDRLDLIEGRVIGASAGQRLVLFARTDAWWVQPMVDQPFTAIKPDSTWKSPTHLGMEYAALLVDHDYHPPAKILDLPSEGAPVAAVATIRGGTSSSPPPKIVQFSGYEWKVRRIMSDRNGPSYFDPANAQTDSNGFLHLRIARQPDHWTCSEVTLTQSLGYGTYLFRVGDISHLEPAVVFSIFTWDERGTDPNHREMDIEMSRWGDPNNKNARFIIQPYYIPANVTQFMAPAGPLTDSLHWEPGKVSFETFRGNIPGPQSRAVAKYVFASGIPSPGSETVRMNFCAFGSAKVPLQNEAEVVIEKFQYLP